MTYAALWLLLIALLVAALYEPRREWHWDSVDE